MERVYATIEERKEEVLRIYDEYLPFMEQYDSDLNFDLESLRKRYVNIKNQKFMLIVAGEAKSGKSTFINAFLGAEILPMDIQQCTSALIEIKYSEKITLEAEYANGRKDTINGEEEIRKFLLEHAALKDDYRQIPITAINYEILIKSKGNIRKSEVEDLIKNTMEDNIYNKSTDEYGKLINDYIQEYKDKWGDIVTKISITYPFTESMKNITMLDSPGVNAAGEVGNVTEQYIEKCDAVILVKSLIGQAAESSSFRQFLNRKINKNRIKAALLLVLTRKGDVEEKEANTVKEQAMEMYRDMLDTQRIAAIDSKVQLYYHICKNKNEEEIDAFFSERKFDVAELCWYKARKNKKMFLQMLQKDSNFGQVGEILDKFAAQAHYIQLLDFLEIISKGYDKIIENIKEKIELLQSSETPEQLKIKIAKKQNEIDEIELKLHEGIDRIRRKYNNEEGVIKQEADKAFVKFKGELSKESEFTNIEKKTRDGQDLFYNYHKNIGEQVIDDCDRELIEITDKTSIPHATIIPIFEAGYFEKIRVQTEVNSYEVEYYKTRGSWSDLECLEEYHHKRPVYSTYKHATLIKDRIVNALEATKNIMVTSLHDHVKKITKTYEDKLKENVDKKNLDLDNLRLRMDDSKKMREERIRLGNDLPKIIHCSENVKSIKGAIEELVSKY